jgi:hypothetical protein
MNPSLSKLIFERETNGFTTRLLELRSWIINEKSFPNLDLTFHSPERKPLRIKLICENYNDDPASIQLLNEDGTFLLKAPIGQGVINPGLHPVTNLPFICSPGSKEYHIHSSHLNDSWENYKGQPGYDLGGMLSQIYNAWKKTVDAQN